MNANNQSSAIFYGWRVVGACTLALIFGYSNVVYVGFGLFVVPLQQAFGWGRGDISLGHTIATWLAVLLAPAIGIAIDRFGARRVLLPSIVLFALVMAAMFCLTPRLSHFYLMYSLIPICAIGTAPATYTRVIVGWFDRSRGLAIGIAMTGIGLGAVIVPPLVQWVIGTWGWRWAYVVLALGVLATLPVVALYFRDSPQELGLQPDGREPAAVHATRVANIGYSAREATRLWSFWAMMISFGLLGIYTAGTLVHLVPMLIDRGTTPSHAALAMSVLGIALIVGRLVTGYLLDRFFAARVAIGFLLCPVLALAAFALGASGDAVIVGAILLGLGMGSEMDLLSYLISRYLGLKAYGQLYGLTYAAFSFGAGIGPIIMGYVHQSTGGYTPALWTLCVLTICALLPFLTLGPYPALPTSSADAGTRVVMGESSEQTAI